MDKHLIISEANQCVLEIDDDSGEIEIGGIVVARAQTSSPSKKSQQWRMVAIDDESNTDGRCFIISAANNNYVLAVEAASSEPGTRLIVWEKESPPEDNQLFIWEDGVLKSCLDQNLVVTVSEAKGGTVTIEMKADLPSQRWKIA